MNPGTYSNPRKGSPNALGWVNFGYVNSVIVIRSSYNVASVVRNSAGNYTVNWIQGMPEDNYCVVGNCIRTDGDGTSVSLLGMNSRSATVGIKQVAQTYTDATTVSVVAFG